MTKQRWELGDSGFHKQDSIERPLERQMLLVGNTANCPKLSLWLPLAKTSLHHKEYKVREVLVKEATSPS
jgi:hypothetical protein